MSRAPDVARAFAAIGYSKVTKGIFRADWGTDDVEHYLRATIYGVPPEFLAVDFGFRNRRAQAFSIGVIRKLGGTMYASLKYDENFDCSMTFSLGKIAGWVPRSSLKISMLSSSELAHRLQADIVHKLYPFIRPISSTQNLYEFLLKDGEPCPWIRSNAAIRAAQVIFLGIQLGVPVGNIRQTLSGYERPIGGALPKSVSPKMFIEDVLGDIVK